MNTIIILASIIAYGAVSLFITFVLMEMLTK